MWEGAEHLSEHTRLFLFDIEDDFFIFFQVELFHDGARDDDPEGIPPFSGLCLDHGEEKESIIFKSNGITKE